MNKESLKTVLMWIFLVLIPPIGIVYMWVTRKDYSNKKKGVLTVVFLVWLVILVLVGIFSFTAISNARKEQEAEAQKTQLEKDADELGIDNTFYQSIKKACTGSGMKASKVRLISANSYASFSKAEVEYEGYRFALEGNAKDTIDKVSYENEVFYENSKTINNVAIVVVTNEQWKAMVDDAEDSVYNRLKAPSTAEFPDKNKDNWKVIRDGVICKVYSYVDAENGFGAMIRTDFCVTYEWDPYFDDTPTFKSITFDD